MKKAQDGEAGMPAKGKDTETVAAYVATGGVSYSAPWVRRITKPMPLRTPFRRVRKVLEWALWARSRPILTHPPANRCKLLPESGCPFRSVG